MNQSTPASTPDHEMNKNRVMSMIVTLPRELVSLKAVLSVFQNHGANVNHLESRSNKDRQDLWDFYITCQDTKAGEATRQAVIKDLSTSATSVQLLSQTSEVPWFPRKIRDLDEVATRVLSAGAELKSDHPGFNDPVYRQRRQIFADIADRYKYGQPIPRVEYSDAELDTWRTVYTNLTQLYPSHACREFNEAFPLLERNCGYGVNNIPQLQDISEYLRERSGFQLRPVAGLLSPRDFLSGLAFRVFHSTQYIRHGSKPMYTPEPDVCHELLGHVPLFADPSFAEFSQEIGLASLGAPDDFITKLSTLYWFTVEFGLCRQDGQLKAYGAGILSSFGELQYCLTDEPQVRSFEPEVACDQEYPITTFQPIYYAAESFHDAKEKLRAFAAKIPRPFNVRYNAYTQSVEVINGKEQVINLTRSIQGDLSLLGATLRKIE